jgi:hypothetical protein
MQAFDDGCAIAQECATRLCLRESTVIVATRLIDLKAAAALTLAAFSALIVANALGLSHAYWAPMSV